jgi:hypothetical protein
MDGNLQEYLQNDRKNETQKIIKGIRIGGKDETMYIAVCYLNIARLLGFSTG